MAETAINTRVSDSEADPWGDIGPVRFVTAASLYDGHDASINIIRRVLQGSGAEVIHLGHNRSVNEIVSAAIEEDAHAIAVSSYQGGHVEYFKYMIDLLRERGAPQVRVFGGGGGVIVPEEIRELEEYGVARIYSPEHGQQLGLQGVIDDMLSRVDRNLLGVVPESIDGVSAGDRYALARLITGIEAGTVADGLLHEIVERGSAVSGVPVVGVTGTGGAGKSSFTDEIIRRFRSDQPDIAIAILAVDPSRRRTGGALLGDRIRMNAIGSPRIYMRSLATRGSEREIAENLGEIVATCKLAGFELVLVETAGIGQGNAAIMPLVDVAIYVMTPEFGAASQLEKIDMLDFADIVAINKFDRHGAEDALRDVRKQIMRNREAFGQAPEDMPVFGTVAAKFNDDGITALYGHLLDVLKAKGAAAWSSALKGSASRTSTDRSSIIPSERRRYLSEVAAAVRDYHDEATRQVEAARNREHLTTTRRFLETTGAQGHLAELDRLIVEQEQLLSAANRESLAAWTETRSRYQADELVSVVRDRKIRAALTHTTLSGTTIPKVALPPYDDHGPVLRWLLRENVPGDFPYTAGVFPLKREGEAPTRMFAGEGDAKRTNERFKYLSAESRAKRLSTAFDSVTLYGSDPDERPDIYGKVGTSGVSIATLDDMKVLYEGFDLCDPATSVSMTINGPAPTILAMFINTAIDQRVDRFVCEEGRQPDSDEAAAIHKYVHENIRGTVQADILKEDQGQNTCLFSTEFSLKVMGDVQAYFIDQDVRNFYSVSISGYHIAEAGANPISQLAFTLANGFTYIEAYRARGMDVDEFAPNFSFFFSAGMDPEYSVLGRVARRIWAVAMRDKYGANERSQKLKYHSQTSGRSLHAQEYAFNDIRTTLQALIATYDNTNSLHTNAYDEAITTPTEESVHRAMAIQHIINQEWGLAKNQNANQGSFIIEQLTDLVEEAVLAEFDRISERGGVLGAMETGYQRGKIQDESLHYEMKKHDGSLPIVGVNTYRNRHGNAEAYANVQLQRSTDEEKRSQIARLHDFHARHAEDASATLELLKQAALEGGNVFAVLMKAVRCCSLGQITNALFEVGGEYRRNT